jgi:hypothetical protein
MKFALRGPEGAWRLVSAKGIDHLSAQKGKLPDSLTANYNPQGRIDIDIEMEYKGESIVTPLGEIVEKGKPYIFSYKKFFQPVDWTVNFYGLDTSIYNPIMTGRLFPTANPSPVKTEKQDKIDYAWWGGIKVGDHNYTQFITVAQGQGDFLKGDYEFGVTWDDAMRFYVDDKLVLDEWQPSQYDFDTSPNKKIRLTLAPGIHHFRIEHLELGGFATIALKIKKL